MAKDTFSQTLGIVCHELRNPVHALLGTLTLLADERGKHVELAPALTSVHTMKTVLDDVLEMQRHGMVSRPSLLACVRALVCKRVCE